MGCDLHNQSSKVTERSPPPSRSAQKRRGRSRAFFPYFIADSPASGRPPQSRPFYLNCLFPILFLGSALRLRASADAQRKPLNRTRRQQIRQAPQRSLRNRRSFHRVGSAGLAPAQTTPQGTLFPFRGALPVQYTDGSA